MIDPKELRIGNLLIYEGKIVVVESIDPLKEWEEKKCSITVKKWLTDKHYTYNSHWLNDFSTIPLTPQWLERCGFVRGQAPAPFSYCRVIQFEDTHYPTKLNILHGRAEISRSEIGAVYMPCEYVHQLQNLFYALTGEELTINEV